MGAEQVSGEVLSWLKTLPVAPEYHPTIQEFQDPISYIFKIEKEASKYGICKIVPPVPPQSKKTVISNFNRSIAERNSSQQPGNPKSKPTFTTRQQQVGFCPRKQRPVQKSVWQSGEHYTLQEFEAKAKGFEKNYFKSRAKKKVSVSVPLSGLEMEALFWKANGDRPVTVEYANDMPGSGFGPVRETGVVGAGNVGETAWNMRGIARSNGSLLRFMKEDIPGVTSPMVYVAMMFSWFAWHVEDHDLHSLNYMHLGAGKTWYGVPRDAATAFEEVIRVHGFAEEINPLVTFAMLGEKTTVMSPEVLIRAGVPCCRLVQNAGDFVVTFPRAYHSGFSHGFNCGEASNIATPEWLMFARDAAIRRASVNYPPMVSHFQLLYDLALALTSSNPSGAISAPRSSRLKDKKRGEGDNLVKQLFVQDIMQNNNLLHTLGKGSAVVLLPQNPLERFICSNLQVGSRYQVKSNLQLHLSRSKEAIKSLEFLDSDDAQAKSQGDKRFKTYSRKAKFSSMGQGAEVSASSGSNVETQRGESAVVDRLSDRGLFSCVKCGIWPFACVAIVQPTESTSRYLMSADFNLDDLLDFGELHDGSVAADAYTLEPNCGSGWTPKNDTDGQYDVGLQSTDQMETVYHCTNSIQSSDDEFEKVDETFNVDSDAEMKRSSALGLLALTYGNSSDSDEDDVPPHGASRDGSWESKCRGDHSASPFSHQEHTSGVTGNSSLAILKCEGEGAVPHSISHSYKDREFSRVDSDDSDFGSSELAEGVSNDSMINKHSNRPLSVNDTKFAEISNPSLRFYQRSDEDSSRMHVFCLEHALELEKLLRPVGGIHIMLLCHSDYPKVEDAAKLVSEELDMDSYWNDTPFRAATKEDEEQIQLALQSEEETPKSREWAVKLGVNLYYSSILCRSPLYSKQMPYNSVIYSAFGCSNPSPSPKEPKIRGKRSSRQKKIVMAGKWCGKVWMSNQVHPFLVKHEVEQERAFGDRLKAEVKVVEKRETARKRGTSSSVPRTVMKRKLKFEEERSIKKMKSQEREVVVESQSDDSVDVGSHQEQRNIGRSLTGKRTIKKPRFPGTEVAVNDSEGSGDVKKTTVKRSIKKARSPEVETQESGESDDSVDVGSHQEQKRSIGRSLTGKRTIKKPRFPGTEVAVSDSEGSGDVKKTTAKRSIKKARSPEVETQESGESDDSVDVGSHQEPKRSIGRCLTGKRTIKKPRFPGTEVAVSDSEGSGDVKKTTAKRSIKKARSPEVETQESGFEDPVEEIEHRQGVRRSIRTQRFKGKTNSLRTSNQQVEAADQCESDAETDVKIASAKKQTQKSKGKKTGGPKSSATKGPKMRLPVKDSGAASRSSTRKAPAKKSAAAEKRVEAKGEEEEEYSCDIEGCTMSFKSEEDLSLHQRNICPVEDCYKKFFSHKYLVQHRRVHEDDRPLKCPWKGCKMSFKWAWARTEHIRVHTGARPYVCKEPGCGQTFRFVSDFSRHKRKTGHAVRKKV